MLGIFKNMWERDVENKEGQEYQDYYLTMEDWIKKHGSDRLNLAFSEGYTNKIEYVRERATKELGDTWYYSDFIDTISTEQDNSSLDDPSPATLGYVLSDYPSLAALRRLKFLKSRGLEGKVFYRVEKGFRSAWTIREVVQIKFYDVPIHTYVYGKADESEKIKDLYDISEMLGAFIELQRLNK